MDSLTEPKVHMATGFFKRLAGLIGKPYIAGYEFWCFPHCQQIHTFGMRFPIDVVFINKNREVVELLENLQPWRISKKVKGSFAVLEMSVGGVKRCSLTVGQKVNFLPNFDNLV